jgi:hypothetical protein
MMVGIDFIFLIFHLNSTQHFLLILSLLFILLSTNLTAIVDAVCSSNKGMCKQSQTAELLHSSTNSSAMNDVEEKHEHADLQDMKHRNDNDRVDDYFATCAC